MQRIGIALTIVVILFGLTVLAQDTLGESPILEISVAGKNCAMEVADADEATPEQEGTIEPPADSSNAETVPTSSAENLPTITLGDDCDDVRRELRIASNGTLWLALSTPAEEAWLTFEILDDDAYPPQLDRRGRYVGCANPERGEHLCRVTVELDGTTYLVEIPIVVGYVFAAPPVTDIATEEPQLTSGWGACGSCDSCGQESNQCVLSPQGECLWDPGICYRPPMVSHPMEDCVPNGEITWVNSEPTPIPGGWCRTSTGYDSCGNATLDSWECTFSGGG